METGIVTQIAQDVVGATSAFLGGIGSSIVNFFDTVVVANGKLTTFAAWTIAFVAIGFGSKFVGKLMHKAG